MKKLAPHELMNSDEPPRGKSTTLANRDNARPRFMKPRTTGSGKTVGFMETETGSEQAGALVSSAAQRRELLSKVPDVDSLMSVDECPAEDYFRESEKHMTELQLTLTNFTQTLVKRGLARDLGIQIMEPHQYTMQSVLEIAQLVQQRHASTDGMAAGCLGRIRKCFRQAVKKQGILNNLLGFIPSDSYSSVICGGFTLILGVRHHMSGPRRPEGETGPKLLMIHTSTHRRSSEPRASVSRPMARWRPSPRSWSPSARWSRSTTTR